MPLALQRHLRDLLIHSNRFVDTPLQSVLDHLSINNCFADRVLKRAIQLGRRREKTGGAPSAVH
jgi:hypothetical protein